MSARPRPCLVVPVGAAALALTVATLVGCGSGVKHPNIGGPTAQPRAENAVSVSQGFTPGAAFPGSVEATVIAAGVVPFASGDRSVTFVVYTAEEAGGQQNVYVAAVENLSPTGLPTAFSQSLIHTFQNDRCMNCHGFPSSTTNPTFDTPGDGFTHGQDVGTDCTTCHDPSSVGVQVWRAPLSFPELRALSPQFGTGVLDLDFRGKTAQQLVDGINDWEMLRQDPALFPQLGTIEDAMEHFMADERIFWALDDGRVPLGRPTKSTPSIDRARFMDLLESWDHSGRRATAEASLLANPFLVNQIGGMAPITGDSHSPAAGYVPLSPPAGTMVGTLAVAFLSTADDLVPGATGPSGFDQLYRAAIEVHVDAMDQLSFQFGGIDLVSESAAVANQRANGNSGVPAMSADGSVLAFESLATDLVGGFVEMNAATDPDVFVSRLGAPVALVSADAGSGSTGGTGGSFRPSAAGGAMPIVAFETDATNLLAGADTNGARDIVFATVDGAIGTRRRASVQTGGSEAGGGDSREASVAVVNGVTLVAFESDKTNLVDNSLPTAQVYLYDDQSGDRTIRLSSRDGIAGNGSSSAPALSPSGMHVAFASAATNLDSVRPVDDNNASDVVWVDLRDYLAGGALAPQRLSINNDGEPGDGASTQPRWTSAVRTLAPLTFDAEVLAFETTADNLGREAESNTILSYVGGNYAPICVLDVTSSQIEIAPGVLRALEDQPIDFSAAASRDLNGDPLSYDWNFGDGTTAQGETASHTYTTSGMFTTTLTVSDGVGGTSVCTLGIQVDEQNDLPVAAVGGPYGPAAVGIGVDFDGSGSMDEDGIITTWTWTFEAPGVMPFSLTRMVPALTGVVFSVPGTYQIELVVADNDGATSAPSVGTIEIVANDPPAIQSVTVSPASTTVLEGESRTFTANVVDENPGALQYAWNVGTGTVVGAATNPSITVRFDVPGNTNVSVQVTDEWGASSSSTPIAITVDGLIRFDDVYAQVIDPSCNSSGCHGSTTTPLMGSLLQAQSNLLTGDPSCAPPPYISTAYVNPGSPTTSILYGVLLGPIVSGSCGGGSILMMPSGGTLTPAQIQLVEDWILQGANPAP